MRDRLTELGEATEVVLVVFTRAENLDGYRTTNALSFPILIDPDRVAYRAFGLGRGTAGRVYGWKATRRYLELIRSGQATARDGLRAVLRPAEDTLQLGGDFVIDPGGRLVYGFWGQGPDDRPSVDDLVAAVRAIEPER